MPDFRSSSLEGSSTCGSPGAALANEVTNCRMYSSARNIVLENTPQVRG